MSQRTAGWHLSPVGLGPALEPLESRTLFGVAPFPTLAMLDNPGDTVVRLQTNFGVIDFDLFDDAAPITVANFVNYVRKGQFDQSFFHRALTPGFVLQGGAFKFDADNSPNLTSTPTDPPIVNEFGRSNTIRTIAMAKLSGNPNSATDQFFINLANNGGTPPNGLDFQNGGFTVFGRVATDASWNVVLAISALSTANISNAPQIVGSPFASALTQVPVTSAYVAPNVTEASLVTVIDAEIIKPGGVQAFYTNTLYYSEGFAGSTINEFLPLGNHGDSTVFYQVIARSEVRVGDTFFRDRVLNTGSIPAHTRGGITISRFSDTANDLVPEGVPYSLEVQATGPMSANLSHYDFGSATGEAFTPVTSLTWGFGDAHKATANVHDFLVWQNPNPNPANLTVTFYFDNTSTTIALNATTEAFRRGGLSLQNVAQLPTDTNFSVVITSDQPIVAALSHYSTAGQIGADTALGVPGQPSGVGVLPLASDGASADETVTFVNPNNSTVVVDIIMVFSDGTADTVASILPIPLNRRAQFSFDGVQNPPVPTGAPFTVRYLVTTPSGFGVYAQTTHSQQFTVNGSTVSDVNSNPFGITAAATWFFAEGFMDPVRAGHDLFETVSIFNPNGVVPTLPAANAAVTVTFNFTDGFQLTNPVVNVASGHRADLNLHTLATLLDQGTNHGRFFYSITVSSTVAIVAQMEHYDLTLGGLQPSGGFGTLGTPGSTLIRLDGTGG